MIRLHIMHMSIRNVLPCFFGYAMQGVLQLQAEFGHEQVRVEDVAVSE